MVHFFFNLSAVVLIYGIKWLREIPLFMADKLSDLAATNRMYAFGYLFIAFFLLPGIIIFMTA